MNSPRFFPYYVWEYVIPRQAICLFVFENEEQWKNINETPEPKVIINRDDYEDLVEFIKKEDPWHFASIKTDRSEDLKLIHRLLDIQEKMVNGNGS